MDFEGDYYRTSKATIYDRPDEPVPIYVAASGPLAAKLAGRVGDGFICTSGKDPALYDELLGKVAEGAEAAGRDPAGIRRMIEIKVSYDRDPQRALDNCRWWAALALTPEQKEGVEDPIEMERARRRERRPRAHPLHHARTTPRRSRPASAATSSSASTSWSCTRPARTRRASSTSSARTCCRFSHRLRACSRTESCSCRAAAAGSGSRSQRAPRATA